MTTQASRTGLYLHGGPGLSAQVERDWFGAELDIDWWDQPPVGPNDSAPLKTLVEAAKHRLRDMQHRQGARVDIVSHSIGAVLAIHLLSDAPDSIASATLINPTFDLRQTLLAVARRTIADGIATPRVSALALAQHPGSVDFVELAVALADVPGRFDAYWSPSSAVAKDRYLRMAPLGPAIDFESFCRIGAAMQELEPRLRDLETQVPVVAIIGASDPMVPEDVDGFVHGRVPGATITTVDAGHMAPFERPSLAWPRHLQRWA